MSLVRQSIAGLAIALLAVVMLWAVWLTGQAENQFAGDNRSLTDCTTPSSWIRYTLPAAGEIASQIEDAGYSLEEILTANCIPPDSNIPVEGTLFLPAEVMAQLEPTCGPPQGWGYYATESGDSLPSLAEEFDVDLETLLRANCFLDPSDFEPGLRIYAPAAAQEP